MFWLPNQQVLPPAAVATGAGEEWPDGIVFQARTHDPIPRQGNKNQLYLLTVFECELKMLINVYILNLLLIYTYFSNHVQFTLLTQLNENVFSL